MSALNLSCDIPLLHPVRVNVASLPDNRSVLNTELHVPTAIFIRVIVLPNPLARINVVCVGSTFELEHAIPASIIHLFGKNFSGLSSVIC
ncbi:MAG: hypothetical protein AABY14_01490 [Nanoarchaeota archaeon]